MAPHVAVPSVSGESRFESNEFMVDIGDSPLSLIWADVSDCVFVPSLEHNC